MTRRILLLTLLLTLFAPLSAWAVQATVTWTDNSSDETGFRVERRDGVDANPFVAQTTTAANVTTFNQAGLTLGTRYCYRVLAVNAFGDSAPTAVVCGTPDTPLPASGISVIFAP